MAEVIELAPHDPLPQRAARYVTVINRFDDRDPHKTVVEVHVTSASGRDREIAEGYGDLDDPHLDEAVAWAERYADERGIDTVVLADRTRGPVEQEVVEDAGRRDLTDSDPEVETAPEEQAE